MSVSAFLPLVPVSLSQTKYIYPSSATCNVIGDGMALRLQSEQAVVGGCNLGINDAILSNV